MSSSSNSMFSEDDGKSVKWKSPSGERFDPTAARLLVKEESNGLFVVTLQVEQRLQRSVERHYLDGKKLSPQPIMEINYNEGIVDLFPQITYFSDRLYRQKYDKIRCIRLFVDPDILPPELSSDSAADIPSLFPAGFIRDFQYGFGLTRELKPLIQSMEELAGVNTFEISASKETEFRGGTYTIHADDFRQITAVMSAITRKYQADSLRDRKLFAHNEILHNLLPEKYEYKERDYEPGTVFKILGGTRASQTILKGRDRKALLQTVGHNMDAIFKHDPLEFLQLQKDIQVVSLDRLIDGMVKRISRNVLEASWQKLFELNPFLLSMLFGQPIVLLQAGATVGGQTLGGGGAKIADLLAKHQQSHNAAIVELKRTGTPLLLKKHYRPGIYGPAKELTETVVQVLDQKLKLTNGIANIKHVSKISELETFSVECVIVAGLLPDGADQLASFELYRSQLKDIHIITYDELLARVRILRELISGERYEGNDDDDELEN